MNRTHLLVTVAALALGACGGGGGGGGGLGSTPTPTPSPTPSPTPTPTPSAALGWNDRTTTRSFTTFTVRREHELAGSDVVNVVAPFVNDPAQVEIRYSTSSSAYHITLPGLTEGRIVENMDYMRPVVMGDSALIARTTATSPPNHPEFVFARLAEWFSLAGSGPSVRMGSFAFGQATPGGDIPLVGTAFFDGVIDGFADTRFGAQAIGDPNRFWGSLNLNVDFGKGSFVGAIGPTVLDCPDYYYDCASIDLPDIGMSGTLASAGSNGLTGQFNTGLAGSSSFTGLFAGPSAAEAFGKFHVPYLDPRDAQQHTLFGVWVAKKKL